MPIDIEKIKRLREKLKLTQEEAATRAGLGGGRSRWNDIENGRKSNINLDTLEAIASTLGVKAKDLLK